MNSLNNNQPEIVPYFNEEDYSEPIPYTDEELEYLNLQAEREYLEESELYDGENEQDFLSPVPYSDEEMEALNLQDNNKNKVGPIASAGYGLIRAVTGPLSLIEMGADAVGEAVADTTVRTFLGKEKADEIKETVKSIDTRSVFRKINESLPEADDELSRMTETVTPAAAIGFAAGGPFGALVSILGAVASQEYLETYGTDGKADTWWQTGVAFAIDAGINLASALGKAGYKASKAKTNPINDVYGTPRSLTEKQIVKAQLNAQNESLQNVIRDFSQRQLSSFDEDLANISSKRFTELPSHNVSATKQASQNMFRRNSLNLISPLEVTAVEAGTAMQRSANHYFQENVINAERRAYNAAREAAADLSGSAPRTLEEARSLRAELLNAPPSADQQGAVRYLDDVISTLEGRPPSTVILDASGNPITPTPTTSTVPANDLINLIQKGNHATKYDSVTRLQSNRLSRVMNTLREETGAILSENSNAGQLYQEANSLHAVNAEIWDTNFMRKVRFSETPENLINPMKKSSNLRNFKQAVTDENVTRTAERALVDNITSSGTSDSQRKTLRQISDELTPTSRGVANELIDVKDPLTVAGGRSQIINSILSETAMSLNTGKKPDKIMQLMSTQKGHAIVRQALSGTSEGRQFLSSVERLFVEDVLQSTLNKEGVIDPQKVLNIIENPETSRVLGKIGGENLTRKFNNLATYSRNFIRNKELYSNPKTQSIFKYVLGGAGGTGVGGLLYALGVPSSVLAGLGVSTAAVIHGAPKAMNYLLTKPRIAHYAKELSKATRPDKVASILPKLIKEIDKEEAFEKKEKK